MTAILCIADNGGVLFNRRRVSRDAAVTADILRLAADRKIHIRPYSAPLFAEKEANILCHDDLAGGLPDGAICFFEDMLPPSGSFDRLVLYRWNRDYPADVFFCFSEGFYLCEKTDFSGVSHPVITREIYERETDR